MKVFHKNRSRSIILILILLLAAFLRLYRISDYMNFLGDEGRDAIIAHGILQGHFTLLGPRASAADFYLGPIYYYMMAPFLAIFRLDPVGPAVMVALFGIATVFLVYYVGKFFFNSRTGLIAAILYAISPVVIIYSHSSWNPNVLPFFSLLTIYLLFNAITVTKPWKYYLLIGFLLGIALQLHYLALFLITIIVCYMFIAYWMLNGKIQLIRLLKYYLQMLAGFLVGISPFLLFEIRHNFLNTRAIINFVFVHNLTGSYQAHGNFISIITNVFFRVFAGLVFDFPQNISQVSVFYIYLWGGGSMLFAVAAIAVLFYKPNRFVALLLSLWLFLGIFLFGFYKQGIYDYYFAFLFPLPFLIAGNLLSKLSYLNTGKTWRVLGISLSVILFLGIFILNLYGNPFLTQPNRQKDQTKLIAQFVISQTDNKPFNFALLSGGNSDYAYRYYLGLLGHDPVTIDTVANDPQRQTVADQLMVVCEFPGCKPLGSPLWEIAGFGRAAIVKNWDVSVVKVYKLVHYSEHPTN